MHGRFIDMARHRCVLFDVDGTIAETEGQAHLPAFNRALQDAGLGWRWTSRASFGAEAHSGSSSAPSIFIQLTGQPLVGATRYEQEVLRCSACQERFTAPLPAEVAPEKYDATCDVSIAIAK